MRSFMYNKKITGVISVVVKVIYLYFFIKMLLVISNVLRPNTKLQINGTPQTGTNK